MINELLSRWFAFSKSGLKKFDFALPQDTRREFHASDVVGRKTIYTTTGQFHNNGGIFFFHKKIITRFLVYDFGRQCKSDFRHYRRSTTRIYARSDRILQLLKLSIRIGAGIFLTRRCFLFRLRRLCCVDAYATWR